MDGSQWTIYSLPSKNPTLYPPTRKKYAPLYVFPLLLVILLISLWLSSALGIGAHNLRRLKFESRKEWTRARKETKISLPYRHFCHKVRKHASLRVLLSSIHPWISSAFLGGRSNIFLRVGLPYTKWFRVTFIRRQLCPTAYLAVSLVAVLENVYSCPLFGFQSSAENLLTVSARFFNRSTFSLPVIFWGLEKFSFHRYVVRSWRIIPCFTSTQLPTYSFLQQRYFFLSSS